MNLSGDGFDKKDQRLSEHASVSLASDGSLQEKPLDFCFGGGGAHSASPSFRVVACEKERQRERGFEHDAVDNGGGWLEGI